MLFTAPHLALVYGSEEDAARAYRDLLDLTVHTRMSWTATIDAFQHWIYTHPDHSRTDRCAAWTELYRRFQPAWVDWTDHEDALGAFWHQQPHLFLHPFYYIEYGISQLAALRLWQRGREDDPETVVRAYRTMLSLGGSRALPELFESAGLSFRFDRDAVAPVAAAPRQALDDLPYGAKSSL